jgi:hypothetical protein
MSGCLILEALQRIGREMQAGGEHVQSTYRRLEHPVRTTGEPWFWFFNLGQPAELPKPAIAVIENFEAQMRRLYFPKEAAGECCENEASADGTVDQIIK